MARPILSDHFLSDALRKFRQGDRKNDPDAAFALALFLSLAEKDPASFKKAKADLQNDKAISDFIGKVRADLKRVDEEDRKILVSDAIEKAKAAARIEIEKEFRATILNEIHSLVKVIETKTTSSLGEQGILKKMLLDAEKQAAKLREELKASRKETKKITEESQKYRVLMQRRLDNMERRLDEAHQETKSANSKLEKARQRAIRYFRISVSMGAMGLLIGLTGLAARFGLVFPFEKKKTSDEQQKTLSKTPKERRAQIDAKQQRTVSHQTTARFSNNLQKQTEGTDPPSLEKIIPLRRGQSGLVDPVTNKNMRELLENGKTVCLPDPPDVIIEMRPYLPVSRRRVRTEFLPKR